MRRLLFFLMFAASAAHGALTLKPGHYLFLDDAYIESSSNVVRRIHSPKREFDGPVVNARDDHNFQPYVTVLREGKRFRMWYNVPVNAGQSHLAHLESADGISWTRPHQVLPDPGQIAFGASVLDEGASFADPTRRYKFLWYHDGLRLAVSADGLTWKANPQKPILTGVNDISHLARDLARDRYIAVFGFPSRPEDGYRGHTQNSSEGYRRCVGQSTSTNGLDWTTPRRIFAPDKQDEGITEFYSIGGVVTRGPTLVGLLKVLRDDLPCDVGGNVDGLGYTVLAWSHDGETWQRDRAGYFDRNPVAQSWDHAMAWMDYQLAVGDDIYIYYGGYARGHKVERFAERQIGLVRIKRDRYVAREATGQGELRTPVIRLQGDQLALNVDARQGGVRVQVLDDQASPIDGFRFADCTPIKVDALGAPVKWKRPLSELRGKPLKLVFEMRNAGLFAFEVR